MRAILCLALLMYVLFIDGCKTTQRTGSSKVENENFPGFILLPYAIQDFKPGQIIRITKDKARRKVTFVNAPLDSTNIISSSLDFTRTTTAGSLNDLLVADTTKFKANANISYQDSVHVTFNLDSAKQFDINDLAYVSQLQQAKQAILKDWEINSERKKDRYYIITSTICAKKFDIKFRKDLNPKIDLNILVDKLIKSNSNIGKSQKSSFNLSADPKYFLTLLYSADRLYFGYSADGSLSVSVEKNTDNNLFTHDEK